MAKKSQTAVAKAMEVDKLEDYKPRLTFRAEDSKEIKDHEVGKTYTVSVKMKMVSKSEGGWDGERGLEATYKVVSAKSGGEYED